jgi:hypothetical protein
MEVTTAPGANDFDSCACAPRSPVETDVAIATTIEPRTQDRSRMGCRAATDRRLA